jgi:selenophosphate synthase
VEVRVEDSEYILLCDAQTSGGLLMSVAPGKVGAVEQRFRERGLFCAKVGTMTERSGTITLVP